MRALSIFIKRSNRSVMSWVHRFGGLSGALHVGRARKAVVDERFVRVRGEEAWIWMALETRSRRPLAPEPSWTRSSPTAYLSLKGLRSLHGVRVLIADGAPWYGACRKLAQAHPR
jgi:transposase-like protein